MADRAEHACRRAEQRPDPAVRRNTPLVHDDAPHLLRSPLTGMRGAYGGSFPTNALLRTGFRRETSVSKAALRSESSHCARGIDALAFARYVPQGLIGQVERKRRMSKLHRLDYKWIVAIAFILGIFMDILDTTIV